MTDQTARPPWLSLGLITLAAAVIPLWWAAPVLGALPRRPRSGGAIAVGLAVAAGWGLRIGYEVSRNGAWPMADLIGRIIPVGAFGVLALTLVLGFLLGSLASRTAALVREPFSPRGATV